MVRFRFSFNPVLVKELRGRMRGPRAYLFLTATLALFGIVSYGIYRLIAAIAQQAMGSGPPGAIIGQGIFTGLVFLATIAICAIAPSLTASAISGEHEHKTYDLLMATPLSSASVLVGKLFAALAYVALMLLAAIPLVSLAFVFGGIAAIDMVQAFLLLLGFALTFGMIGLFFSALFRRTALAVGASYVSIALFVLGTVFAYAVIGVMRGEQPPGWLLALNPFSAIASALAGTGPATGYSAAGVMQIMLLIAGGRSITNLAATRPLWQFTIGIYAWLTVVLFLATTQLVKPVRRFQPRRRVLLIVGIVVVVSVVAPLIIYGPFTPDRLVSAFRWLRSPERNLIENSTFDQPLEPQWETQLQAQGEAQIKTLNADDRTMVRLSRSGDKSSENTVTQTISQTLPADGWLMLRVVLRVQRQDQLGCGQQGDECPLSVHLNYEDADGGKREWTQGFYAAGDEAAICSSCDSAIRVPQGQWYTYESRNLLEDPSALAASLSASNMSQMLSSSFPPPPVSKSVLVQRQTSGYIPPGSTLRSISISAAGTSYTSDVAEVALLLRDGRPLEWQAVPNQPLVPTPVPAMVAPQMIVVPAVPLAAPATTAPPTPAPTPTTAK